MKKARDEREEEKEEGEKNKTLKRDVSLEK
jgi:hypothetical protein